MSNTVSWNLQLAVKPGKLDTARSLTREMVEATKSEEGAMTYEWFFSDDGSKCHINEGYVDSAAALVHLGNFGANYAERFLDCFEPTSFNVYGQPSAEVRGVLDGFGANYLGREDGFRR